LSPIRPFTPSPILIMRTYLIRRLLLFVPTLLGVSIAIFILLRVIPGDIASIILGGPSGEGGYSLEELEELRELLGLNRSIVVQYFDWIWDMIRGDLGDSYLLSRPISDELQRQFPVTLELALFAAVIITVIAIPIGVVAAIKRDTLIDVILRGWAILGLAAPTFFVALLVILGLSLYLRWLPPVGFVHLWDDPIKSVQQLLIPALALGFSTNGLLLRMTRTQLLEVLGEDYVRTARAKGLSESIVIWRHAVRNALLPIVTIAGFQIGGLLSGTVVIETVFNIPGVGQGLVRGLNSRDLPLIQAYILYFATMALTVNLLVDLTYAWLDPRIRYD
jgi:peptide/nickel transport system permease protein